MENGADLLTVASSAGARRSEAYTAIYLHLSERHLEGRRHASLDQAVLAPLAQVKRPRKPLRPTPVAQPW